MQSIEKFDLATVEGYKIYMYALLRVKHIEDQATIDSINASVTIGELQAIEQTL